MGFLGTGSYEDFQRILQGVPEKYQEAFMNYATISPLLKASLIQFDPEYQKQQLKLADEAQTKKGWKSLMFNTLGSGLENLTKGIGMSMNPYGTPEAARYAADMMASSGDRLAAAFAAALAAAAIAFACAAVAAAAVFDPRAPIAMSTFFDAFVVVALAEFL
jgi:hypothetical protein